MRSILVLLYILAAGALFADCFRKKFEETLAFALISIALLAAAAGMLGSFRAGILVSIGGMAAYFLWRLAAVHKGGRKPDRKQIFSSGFYLTIFLFLLVLALNWVRGFTHYDDFQHWGPMVQYNVLFDRVYTFDHAHFFAHKDYPPIIASFETVWCILSGGFSEAYAIRAIQFLSFSFLLPLCCRGRKEKNAVLCMLLSIAAIVIVQLTVPDLALFFYSSLYVDCMIAICYGFGLYYVFQIDTDSPGDLFLASLYLTFTAMIKQISIAFAGLLLICILIRMIRGRKQSRRAHYGYRWLLVLLPAAAYLGWSWFAGHVPATGPLIGQFSVRDILDADIPGILSGRSGASWQQETVRAFAAALGSRYILWQPFKLGYTASILLVNLLFLPFLLQKGRRADTVIRLAVYDIGAAGYAFGMLLLYLTSFGPAEGPTLASYERYLGTYVLAGFILLLCLVYEYFRESVKAETAALAVVICLSEWKGYRYLLPSTTHESWGDSLYPVAKTLADEIPAGSSLLIMEQGEKDLTGEIFQFYLEPMAVEAGTYAQTKADTDSFTVVLTLEEFEQKLSQYDYFYLYSVDDETYYYLQNCFDQKEIVANALYKVETGDAHPLLVRADR